MKKSSICIFAFLGLALLMGSNESTRDSVTAEQAVAIEKAILQTHDKIIAAAEKRDADEMFSYIAENDKGCIIQDGRLIMTRQEALDSVKQSFAGTTNVHYDFRQRNVKVLSPTIAILTAVGNVTVTFESGQSFTSEFANTSVFVLQDNAWKIIHGHHSVPNP